MCSRCNVCKRYQISHTNPFIKSANNNDDDDSDQGQASRNVDDPVPVADMNHQTLLYTIFGSLDLLIARHTVLCAVCIHFGTFESPAVLWHVWRVEQCE